MDFFHASPNSPIPHAQPRVLEVRQLAKRYGRREAVAGISFSVHRHEIVGLLGPNGAGKTTTINMLLGVLAGDGGEIRIDGLDLKRQRSQALGRTNFAAIYAPLPGNLSVRQNLRLFGMLYDVPALETRIGELLEQFELQTLAETKCGLLSSGEQTRVSLAKAMLNQPRLLLLDEPTASLDPAKAHELRQLIRGIATEHDTGILWTSHNMQEVEAVCDRVLFLSRGRILLEGDPRQLPRAHGYENLDALFIGLAGEGLQEARP
ncbi:ABC-2 type transport system ATP-binding protein [Solimonas aquatica]|uniref:ABC-2 type transport system ATP-binding protein n=1 Tax=Solimonas aquatica TaxID=489703 RepID=A0A1H9I025_9GAMM|nr:ABC transporter ATP-binding protein [Solimonas aquatica]SEQ67961.1 ABC-2 type transport system ATP-binding protein [Solimonas aquatica]